MAIIEKLFGLRWLFSGKSLQRNTTFQVIAQRLSVAVGDEVLAISNSQNQKLPNAEI